MSPGAWAFGTRRRRGQPAAYGAALRSRQKEDAVAGVDRVALVLGSEGHGLSARWEQAADRRAIIPMREGIDSLNVAAATAVACYVTARR